MTAVDDGELLPAPGGRPIPKPAPPPAPPYTRNPLLDYVVGPDPDGACPACEWVHAPFGHELCPHHVAWRDIKAHAIAGAGDVPGTPAGYPTTQPGFARGQQVWFQGKLHCRITVRYWGADGRWRYVAKALSGGAAIDGHEDLFTTARDGAPS